MRTGIMVLLAFMLILTSCGTEASTPKPLPEKLISDGEFAVSCEGFTQIYEKQINENAPSSYGNNLTLVKDEGLEGCQYSLLADEQGRGISISLSKGDKVVTDDSEGFDTVAISCDNWTSSQLYVFAFQALIQISNEGYDYDQAGDKLMEMINEIGTEAPSIVESKVGNITFKLGAMSSTLLVFTATTNPE